MISVTLIEKKNPLKQGLKLNIVCAIGGMVTDWKEESIKTRIETNHKYGLPRTVKIEKKNPLKQGLKLNIAQFNV